MEEFIDSLSDGELRRRLLQRGVQGIVVALLVRDRETERAKIRIAKELR